MSSFPRIVSYQDNLNFLNNFEIVDTSVPKPKIEETQVIGLPEMHFDKDSQLKNGWFVQKFYREGDVVLVELPAGSPVDQSYHQTKFVQRKIIVKGWDDPASDQMIKKHIAEFRDLKETLLKEDNKKINLPNRIRPFYDQITNKHDRDQINGHIEKFKAFKTKKERGNHLNLTLKNLGDAWFEIIQEKTIKARQEMLFNSVRKWMGPGRRVFIIAGNGHLLTDEEVCRKALGAGALKNLQEPRDLAYSKEVFSLRQKLSNFSYMILNGMDSPPTIHLQNEMNLPEQKEEAKVAAKAVEDVARLRAAMQRRRAGLDAIVDLVDTHVVKIKPLVQEIESHVEVEPLLVV